MPLKSEFISMLGGSSNLSAKLKSLKPTPGYCIFIDVVGSTKIKKGITHPWQWVFPLLSTLELASISLHKHTPIKAIGDELMYYIEDSDLAKNNETPTDLLLALCDIQKSNTTSSRLKIGATRCQNVYSITFLKNKQDYYGLGVDFAARLASIAKEDEILIEHEFYDQIPGSSKSKNRISRTNRQCKDFESEAPGVYLVNPF